MSEWPNKCDTCNRQTAKGRCDSCQKLADVLSEFTKEMEANTIPEIDRVIAGRQQVSVTSRDKLIA